MSQKCCPIIQPPPKMPSQPGNGHVSPAGLHLATLCVLAGRPPAIPKTPLSAGIHKYISARWWWRELAFSILPHLRHSTSLAFHLAAATRPYLNPWYDSAGSLVLILPRMQIIVCVLDVFVSSPTLSNRPTKRSSGRCRNSASLDARYTSPT